MLTHPIGYASYAVSVRQYRYLQSGLLQCMDRSKPPCHLLMLRVTNPAHKRLALSGFLFLRTIFIIQGTHKSIASSQGCIGTSGQIAVSIGSGWTVSI